LRVRGRAAVHRPPQRWPLDSPASSPARHKEAGFQPDLYQINAYIKAYYYGFPWDSHVRTRVGHRIGLAYATQDSADGSAHLADRAAPDSKLLILLITVDISVGDVLGARSLRDT